MIRERSREGRMKEMLSARGQLEEEDGWAAPPTARDQMTVITGRHTSEAAQVPNNNILYHTIEALHYTSTTKQYTLRPGASLQQLHIAYVLHNNILYRTILQKLFVFFTCSKTQYTLEAPHYRSFT